MSERVGTCRNVSERVGTCRQVHVDTHMLTLGQLLQPKDLPFTTNSTLIKKYNLFEFQTERVDMNMPTRSDTFRHVPTRSDTFRHVPNKNVTFFMETVLSDLNKILIVASENQNSLHTIDYKFQKSRNVGTCRNVSTSTCRHVHADSRSAVTTERPFTYN